MLSYIITLALLATALVSANPTNGIRQCGNQPFVQQVRIEGCTETPCYVTQGSDVRMEVDFRSLAAQSLRPQVFATALGTTIEYILPIDQQEACRHLTSGSCPVSANEDLTYRFVFPITPIYPPIPVTVELRMFNQANEVVFCKITDIIVRLR